MIDSFNAGFVLRETRHRARKRRILNPEVLARTAYTDYRYQGMRHCWSFRCNETGSGLGEKYGTYVHVHLCLEFRTPRARPCHGG